MNAETKSLEGSIKALEAERDVLNRTLVEREENHQNQNRTNIENEHRIKHELSLFAHISKINWTNTDKDASKIQGTSPNRHTHRQTERERENQFLPMQCHAMAHQSACILFDLP